MKTIQLSAICALLLVWAGVAQAATDVKPAAITVVSVQGEARYSVDGQSWHPLVVGKILRAGAVVETAAGSSASLILSGTPVPVPQSDSSAPQSIGQLGVAPDPNLRGYETLKPMAQQNVVSMGPDTMLAVDKLTVIDTGVDTVGDTELDLRAGKIFVNAKKLSAGSQYIIKLPNGVAGIRGACFNLDVFGHCNCLFGQVVLSIIGPNGQPVLIPVVGGYSYNPTTGQLTNLSPIDTFLLRLFGYNTQTLFVQSISNSHDLTTIYISPQQGVNPKPTGGGGGGG